MLNEVALAVGALGLLLATVFYFKSPRRAVPSIHIEDSPVVGSGGIDGVEVRYHGDLVPQVSAASIWLWNAGTVTLHGTDFAAADPLCIRVSGDAEILRANIDDVTRDVIGPSLERESGDRSQVLVTFDFLDPGDGLAISVLHTGPAQSVHMQGTVKGEPKGFRATGQYWAVPAGERPSFLTTVGLGVLFTIMGTTVGIAAILDDGLSVIGNAIGAAVGVGMMVVGLLFVRGGWQVARRFPRSLVFGERRGH